jgi:5'-3' exonuclease
LPLSPIGGRLILSSSPLGSAGVAEPPRLFLIDAGCFIFRAFYAIPHSSNSSGLPTNAIFGFANLLLKFLKRYRPEYVAVALDDGRGNFRKRLFPSYKANRAAPPADLLSQLPYMRRVLEALSLPLLELPGCEADDIIATLCATLRREDCELVIVSSDKDLMQLVTDHVRILDTHTERWLGVAEVESRFGVRPEKVTQVMGLMGDPVDNIPGVTGIGEKTAIALIQRFQSLEYLFDNLDQVESLGLRGAARARRMLESGKTAAFLSRDLATVKRDLPLAVELKELKFEGFNRQALRALFAEMEFTNLVVLLDNDRL